MNFDMPLPKNFAPIQRRPLYLQTMEQVREMLRSRKPGERIETEPELLRILGVSAVTLRRAIGELEREGIIERRQGSGTYYLGDSPVQRKHVAVVLGVDETSANLSPYFPKMVREIRKALGRLGIASRPYHGDLPLGIEATGIHCPDFFDDVRLGRISGMISFFTYREPGWVSLLRKHNIPFIDPLETRTIFPRSNFLPWAIDLADRHGRRKVAAVTWESPTDGVNPFTRELTALAEKHKIGLERSWLDASVNGWEPGMGWERFRDIWRSAKEKPDMLIVGDDMVFSDVQHAILELGIRVPEDLLVVVRGSDVYQMDLRVPVALYIGHTLEQAEAHAAAMKARLDGAPYEAPKEVAHHVEFFDMEALFSPLAGSPAPAPQPETLSLL